MSGGFDVSGLIVEPDLVSDQILSRARPDRLLLRFSSLSALEQARSVLDRGAPGSMLATGAESENSSLDGAVRTRRALVLVSLLAFLVGGVGSVAFIMVGVIERRREYALLRVSGVPLSVLRWSMITETAVPMLTSALVATVLGFSVALVIVGSSLFTPVLGWAMVWPSLLKRVTDYRRNTF
ncbi:FtsX-like permease family protein [Actinoplanes sp. URMC 104]|uniref:FtsX-like permease family protein n=1 Tax=Actinoplanes sp. URMC 104 TaxID=3423409 RepID=UPI003F1DF4AF